MIEGARRLSRQHITIRVPWHDARWTGTVCKAPGANTSCLALTRIAAGKQPSEDADAGRPLIDLDPAARPPCVDERVAFLADHDLIVKKRHPYELSR